MKIERKWKYGHNMPHTLNIFFCRDLKKVHFIFQTPLTVKIEKWWGGYHPLGWNLLKMGGNSPPGGISPPFPFCQIWEGGDITTFLESYAKWGGFHTWGGYHPLVPIWPQSTGGEGQEGTYLVKYRVASDWFERADEVGCKWFFSNWWHKFSNSWHDGLKCIDPHVHSYIKSTYTKSSCFRDRF